MSAGDIKPWFTLDEVSAFLDGSGTLGGVAFGDRHPTERGAFWWRKHLRAAIQADRASRAPSPQGDAEDSKRLDWLEVHFADVRCIYKDAAGEVRSLYIDCDEDSISDGDRGRIRSAVDAARSTPATEKGAP